MSLLLFTPAAKHTFTTINEKKRHKNPRRARKRDSSQPERKRSPLFTLLRLNPPNSRLLPPPQGFPVGAGVPELRGGLRLLRAERQPLPELRRASPPARAPVRRPVSASARRAGPAVPPLPAGLPGVQPTGPVHG